MNTTNTEHKFPHEIFLKENHIDPDTLPRLLRRRVKGFEEVKGDLEHVTDEDLAELREHLDDLSLELEEDLEEHFEQQLQHNETEDEDVEDIAAQPLPEEPAPVDEPAAAPEPEPPAPMPSDADILERLWKTGTRNVSVQALRSAGYTGPLQDKQVRCGKFFLRKKRYEYSYQLAPEGDN